MATVKPYDALPGSPTFRKERIYLETVNHRITGELTLPNDVYRSRLSDLLNSPDRSFLALTNATLERLEGGPMTRHEFLAVSRQQIIYVVNLDEPGDV